MLVQLYLRTRGLHGFREHKDHVLYHTVCFFSTRKQGCPTVGLYSSICHWIKDFLNKVSPYYSSTFTQSQGAPHGCVLRPLIYTIYTHDDRNPTHLTNTTVEFADVNHCWTNEMGQNSLDEVPKQIEWCVVNKLASNASKTKELENAT